MQELREFVAGFQRFQKNYFHGENNLFAELRQGQKPVVLFIACSDSRVDPALITDCNPGDMFVIRNIANLVPPFCPDQGCRGVSSAIEYAVRDLKVDHIVVLGHSHCGGINALMHPDEHVQNSQFISRWMSIADRAREQVVQSLPDADPEEQQRACELAAILVSLENLLTYPWIAERAEKDDILIHGCYFDMEHGKLYAYDTDDKAFLQIA